MNAQSEVVPVAQTAVLSPAESVVLASETATDQPVEVEAAHDDMTFDVLILRDEQFRPRGAPQTRMLTPRLEPSRDGSRPPSSPRDMRLEKTFDEKSTVRPWIAGRLPLLFAGAFIGLSSAALAGRHQLVSFAPPTSAVFDALGLPANSLGMEVRDVKSALHEFEGKTYLVVEGHIVNLRKTSRRLGELHLSLRDDNGRDIYQWSTAAPASRLEGGAAIAFKTRLASPLGEARDVRVSLAPQS